MSSPYRVQDLIDQNALLMVERVSAADGAEFVRTRLKLAPQELAGLFGEGVFENALSRLRSLKHADLRQVTDGGMDELDGSPWVTSLWVEGKALSGQRLEEKEIRRRGAQCQRLMEDLGEFGSAVNFDATQILTERASNGELRMLFSIDYSRWFRDAAAGAPLGGGKNEAREVRKLLEGLVIEQLKLPHKKIPIPFVEDRSPSLSAYQAPRGEWVMSILVWIGLLMTLGAITWLTLSGMKRMKENPRKEVPAWNAPGR